MEQRRELPQQQQEQKAAAAAGSGGSTRQHQQHLADSEDPRASLSTARRQVERPLSERAKGDGGRGKGRKGGEATSSPRAACGWPAAFPPGGAAQGR